MCTPFLKWAGGKRWVTPALTQLVGHVEGKYIEPFLGSGSLFFNLNTSGAMLADINSDLVATFRVVRDNPEGLIARLADFTIDKEKFKAVRAWRPVDPVCRAARFIYLNKTAFNGLYRVNKQGDFNVPFGCKPGTQVCEPEQILSCSGKLQEAIMLWADFRFSLSLAKAGDLVFVDPPYTVKHGNNGFRRYNERIFSWRDQLDLAALVSSLVRRGVTVVLMNAWHRDVARLYEGELFCAVRLSRASNMAASVRNRGEYEEVLLVSRDCAKSTRRLAEVISSEYGGQRVAECHSLGNGRDNV